MIRRFQIQNKALIESDADDSPVQVFINPDAEEKDILLRTYDIDEHTLTSALDPDEVSRVEITPEQIFLIYKRPRNFSSQDNFFFNVTSAGLILLKDRLVIISSEDFPLVESGFKHSHSLNSPLDLMLTFLHDTVYHFLGHLKVIKQVARELELKITASIENKHLIQMFNLSESLAYYINAINSNSGVLVKLRNHIEKNGYPPETLEHLDDVNIDNNQCYEQAKTYSTVFAGLMDARGNLVNNNVNVLLRKLTIINVVFLPLNLIASIGGMSEFTMMTRGINWRVSYFLFFAVMILIGWLTAYFLGRMNFGRNSSPKRN
jgi:magnesium transporter